MARTTRGSIFKRGKYYWLQYSINKERIRIPLKNDKGESITTVAEARIAADKILSVIRTKDEAQRLRLIQSELDNAKKKETQARQDLENSLAVIAAGWDIFMQCPNRPACCRRVPADKLPPHSTPANYACQYRKFTEWLRIHHKKVTLISEITPKIAAAYAQHLENSGLASGTINKHINFLKLFFKPGAEIGAVFLDVVPNGRLLQANFLGSISQLRCENGIDKQKTIPVSHYNVPRANRLSANHHRYIEFSGTILVGAIWRDRPGIYGKVLHRGQSGPVSNRSITNDPPNSTGLTVRGHQLAKDGPVWKAAGVNDHNVAWLRQIQGSMEH